MGRAEEAVYYQWEELVVVISCCCVAIMENYELAELSRSENGIFPKRHTNTGSKNLVHTVSLLKFLHFCQ